MAFFGVKHSSEQNIVPTIRLTLDVTISALLTMLRFTLKHSTLCFRG